MRTEANIIKSLAAAAVLLAAANVAIAASPREEKFMEREREKAEATRLLVTRLSVLVHSDDRRQVVLLRSYLLGECVGTPEQGKVEALDPNSITTDDVAWLCTMASSLGYDSSDRSKYLLGLLSVLYKTTESVEARQSIIRTFDEKYGLVLAQKDATDVGLWRRRELLWSMLLSSLAAFGSPEMLTPAFWAALEVGRFREGRVLLVHANEAILQKLASYKDTPVWDDDELRRKIERLTRDVGLILEYPQVRQLGKYLRSSLDSLSMKSPKRRAAWLDRHLKDMAKALERDRKAALEAAVLLVSAVVFAEERVTSGLRVLNPTAMVGEPLYIEVSYAFSQPQKTSTIGGIRRSITLRRPRLETMCDKDKQPRTWPVAPVRLDAKGPEGKQYVGIVEVLFDVTSGRLILDREGQYTIMLRDSEGRYSAPVQLTVLPASEDVQNALLLLLGKPRAVTRLISGEGKDAESQSVVKALAKTHKRTTLSLMASARSGLDSFMLLRVKYPSFEKWRSLRRKGEAQELSFEEARSNLSAALALPLPSRLREEALFQLIRLEAVAGNFQKSQQFCEQLGREYPNGKYGSKATKISQELKDFHAKEQAETKPSVPTGD